MSAEELEPMGHFSSLEERDEEPGESTGESGSTGLEEQPPPRPTIKLKRKRRDSQNEVDVHTNEMKRDLEEPTREDTKKEAFGTSAPEQEEREYELWNGSEEQMKKLVLKRILKENHGSTIHQIAFNFRRQSLFGGIGDPAPSEEELVGDSPNVLASVGGPQANIYDNEHDVDHLDIMSHFVIDGHDSLDRTAAKSLGEMLTCCWVRVKGDAVLAAGGTGGVIHILSLAFSTETKQLLGHTGPIVDLLAHPLDDSILVSVSKDHSVRFWYVPSGKCIALCRTKGASAVCFDTKGDRLLIGTTKGDILACDLPDQSAVESQEPVELASRAIGSSDKKHGAEIDCLLLAGDYLLSKSTNGRILQWRIENFSHIRTIQLKNSQDNKCRMDVSNDARYFCVGNAVGTVFIFSLETGHLLKELSHKRSTKGVRCCVFSLDGRNVVSAGEGAFIWRFDYPRH